jgi:hypothetical protein
VGEGVDYDSTYVPFLQLFFHALGEIGPLLLVQQITEAYSMRACALILHKVAMHPEEKENSLGSFRHAWGLRRYDYVVCIQRL